MVEKIRPKIIVPDMGLHTTDFPPIPTAVGSKLAMVVREVSRIGRRRVPAAGYVGYVRNWIVGGI